MPFLLGCDLLWFNIPPLEAATEVWGISSPDSMRNLQYHRTYSADFFAAGFFAAGFFAAGFFAAGFFAAGFFVTLL
jgi:hypothetical protein